MKTVWLTSRIKLFYLNQDLNRETFISLKKFLIMNTIFLCKMISTQMVIHNGFFSKSKIQEKIHLSNSILWTLPSLILYSISEWKWAFTLKKTLTCNKLKNLKNKVGKKEVSTFRTILMELGKTTITWAKASTHFHLVINFCMMMIQYTLLTATHIPTAIWSMTFLRLKMMFRKGLFAQGNFYAKPWLEMIAMWSRLPKRETFKLCKLKKLLLYLREFIREKL